MPPDGYAVAIKRSARRIAPAAGRWVNREGPRRVFDTKALAREWAREMSGPHGTVWVQDASGETGVDGYLVGSRRVGVGRGTAGNDPDSQAPLERF